ncbi:MAG: sigma-70 family RNA polymerase sigma factor [Ilumatobacteraceae bacterium]
MVGPEVAADVVADVFANLVALGPSRWDTVDDQRGYLFRCVLNATRMHARSNGRRTAREQFASRLRTGPTLPAADAFSDPWVGDAIASLSVQQRAVIYHTYWDDLTPTVTAGLLGVSVATVKRQLARARSKMRKVLYRASPNRADALSPTTGWWTHISERSGVAEIPGASRSTGFRLMLC